MPNSICSQPPRNRYFPLDKTFGFVLKQLFSFLLIVLSFPDNRIAVQRGLRQGGKGGRWFIWYERQFSVTGVFLKRCVCIFLYCYTIVFVFFCICVFEDVLHEGQFSVTDVVVKRLKDIVLAATSAALTVASCVSYKQGKYRRGLKCSQTGKLVGAVNQIKFCLNCVGCECPELKATWGS